MIYHLRNPFEYAILLFILEREHQEIHIFLPSGWLNNLLVAVFLMFFASSPSHWKAVIPEGLAVFFFTLE